MRHPTGSARGRPRDATKKLAHKADVLSCIGFSQILRRTSDYAIHPVRRRPLATIALVPAGVGTVTTMLVARMPS